MCCIHFHLKSKYTCIIVFSSDTAYCKNAVKNAWYYFDDSSVSESSEEATVVCYILNTNLLSSYTTCPCTNLAYLKIVGAIFIYDAVESHSLVHYVRFIRFIFQF